MRVHALDVDESEQNVAQPVSGEDQRVYEYSVFGEVQSALGCGFYEDKTR